MAREIIMVSPDHFGFNEETATSNSFQKNINSENLLAKAIAEFNQMVALLKNSGIEVHVFPSPKNYHCPDAVFPNNWISTHSNGNIFTYPMLTPNRRAERNQMIIDFLLENYQSNQFLDFSTYENDNIILEGTGSIVFDHQNKLAYACVSPRTNEKLLNEICKKLDYKSVVFEAVGPAGEQVYHTNVVMAVGKHHVIICLDAIENTIEQSMLKSTIENSRKILIPISFAQMLSFAGNMIELENKNRETIWVMSETTFNVLTDFQKDELKTTSKLLPVSIPTIESIGGGSARCMIAEIFLEKK